MNIVAISIILALLWEFGIIPLFIVACVVIFLLEHKKILLAVLIIVIVCKATRKYLLRYKYKNETQEERKRREELEKIREWCKRNSC